MPAQFFKQRSYLLRLWPVQIQGSVVWHANLMRIPDGEALGFAGLPQLFAYLERECEKQSPGIHPIELPRGDFENELDHEEP